MPDVHVIFLPERDSDGKAPRASGVTDANGRYELQTDAGERGAVVGQYRVCIDPDPNNLYPRYANTDVLTKMEGKFTFPKRVPVKYRKYEKTPLRAEVKHGPQTIDFEVPASSGP